MLRCLLDKPFKLDADKTDVRKQDTNYLGFIVWDFFILGGIMKGSIAIQVLPETSRDDIFNKVDKVIEYIDQTGLDYEVGAFETTVDGEFDDLMDIIRKAHELMLEEDMEGVHCYIKTSFRKNGDGWSIEDKTKKYRK